MISTTYYVFNLRFAWEALHANGFNLFVMHMSDTFCKVWKPNVAGTILV